MTKEVVAVGLLTLGSLHAESNYTLDGYIRGSYQYHNVKNDKIYRDDALGGKIHFETAPTDGVSLGAGIYGTTALFNDDNRGLVPLRGDNHKSYGIVGEAYLKGEFGKNLIKLGRQEIETPFAQVDDIGMIPNTFEALTLINSDIKDTTIFLGEIQKMAGVDAEVIDKFTKLNGSKGMQVLGLTYEGIENLSLMSWYYRLSGGEIDTISYLEADYEQEFGSYGYSFGLQYAKQGHNIGGSTKVLGGTLSFTAKNMGLTLTSSYNETKDGSAFSGFGGGPFFSNSEYLIIDNGGDNCKAKWIGGEFDASILGLDGLSVGLGKITLEQEDKRDSTEMDLVASYAIDKDMEIHLIYSDLKGSNVGEDDAKHLRVYANYNF